MYFLSLLAVHEPNGGSLGIEETLELKIVMNFRFSYLSPIAPLVLTIGMIKNRFDGLITRIQRPLLYIRFIARLWKLLSDLTSLKKQYRAFFELLRVTVFEFGSNFGSNSPYCASENDVHPSLTTDPDSATSKVPQPPSRLDGIFSKFYWN